MKRALALLAFLAACSGPAPILAPRPFAVPDTIYTASGAIPVLLVDSIASDEPGKLVIGRFDYLGRRLYVSRVVKDEKVRIKVTEHERCHAVLAESGLQMHFSQVPWLIELVCDAFSNAAVSQLERGKP